jgi:uncharacterized protein (DUF2141 family)
VGQLEEKTTSVIIKDYASANGWVNDSKYSTVKIDDNIEAKMSGGAYTSKYFNNGTNWRLYQTDSGKLTITASSGTIVSIKITYTIANTGILTYNGNQQKSGILITVNDSSAEFKVENTASATNGQVRITAIEVVYKAAAPACEHEWLDATCETAKKCSKCNCTIGEALGHVKGDVVIENISFESNRKGYAITSDKDHTIVGDITVINCKFKGLATEKNYGIYKNPKGDLKVINCTFDNYNNALCGIKNEDGSVTEIIGCTFTNINDEAIGYINGFVPADFEATVIANNTGLTEENVIGY